MGLHKRSAGMIVVAGRCHPDPAHELQAHRHRSGRSLARYRRGDRWRAQLRVAGRQGQGEGRAGIAPNRFHCVDSLFVRAVIGCPGHCATNEERKV